MAVAKKAVKPAGKAVVVAKAPQTDVAVPAHMVAAFAENAGKGLENASARDFALPFLYVLQKGSPEVDENDDRYVAGAKPGMLIDTVSKELYETGLCRVIPCDFQKVFNEWVPRDAGGGFIKSWPTMEAAEEGKREDTQIVETANHYCLIQKEDGSWTHIVFSLTSTKLKGSRNWLSRISQRLIDTPKGKKVAPSFACIYCVETVSAQNEHGTFFTVAVQPVEGEDGWVQEQDVFDKAIEFRAQLVAGIMRTEFNKAPSDPVEGEDRPKM